MYSDLKVAFIAMVFRWVVCCQVQFCEQKLVRCARQMLLYDLMMMIVAGMVEPRGEGRT